MKQKIRFALVGAGWRAAFFARIAKAIPKVFELTGTWMHTPEKGAEWQRCYGGRVTDKVEQLLDDRPDFLVQAVAKPVVTDMLIRLVDLNVPILCETTPFLTAEDGQRLWQHAKEKKIQIAEQYPLQPLYQSWKKVIAEGLIGEVSNLSISTVHSYHAISLIRQFLSVGFQNASISGERYFFPVKQTDSRQGIVLNGELQMQKRDRVSFVFENKKTAFFDFSHVQYHSFIRKIHLNIQGTQGEIDDDIIRFLNKSGQPVQLRLTRKDFGAYDNRPLSHYGMAVGENYTYLNPFPYIPLNDDEIAIAECLLKMKAYVCEEGEGPYPLAEGMQDAYLALEMEKALLHSGSRIQSITQPWAF